jgi:hypothetical protein
MQKYGAVGTVAAPLFNEYLLAFELTSILLLVASRARSCSAEEEDANAR